MAWVDNWGMKCFIFIVSYTVLPLCLLIFAVPNLFLRQFAIITARLFKPELGEPLSPEAGLVSCDKYYDGPTKHNVVGVHYTDRVVERNKVIQRMQEIIDSDRFPELKQKLCRWVCFYFWGDCESFKLEDHIVICPFEGSMTRKDVQKYQDHLCSKPWIPDRPFWEIVLFPQYISEDGGSAFALKVHHTLADGVAQLSLFNAISGITPEKIIKPAETKPFWTIILSFFEYLFHVYSFVYAFAADFDFNSWITGKPLRVENIISYEEYLDIITVKKAAKAENVSVTDFLMATYTKALREEMIKGDDDVPSKMSALFPLPRRNHPGRLTNHVVLSTLELPVGIADSKGRYEFLAAELRKKKAMAPVTCHLMNICGTAAQFQQWHPTGPYCSTAVTTFSIPYTWNLGGAEIMSVSYSFELSEHIPIIAMFIGYRDKMQIWVKGRADVLPEERLQRIVAKIVQDCVKLAN